MFKVSVIIPIYNAESTLSETISSVINQTYRNLELILIDDGSTDSSLKICLYNASIDSRIIVKSQKNTGVSSARNKGLETSTGDWIYFLDSDDIIGDNFLKNVSSYFKEDIDLIQFGSKQIKCGEIVSHRQSLENDKMKIVNDPTAFIQTSDIGALCVWLHIIRREVISINGILFADDMTYNEDLLFMYNILVNSKKFLFLGKTYHTQLLVSNSLSRSPMNETKINNRLLLVERILEIKDKNILLKNILEIEATNNLKGYFGSLLIFDKQNNININNFNYRYREFYLKRKKSLKGFFPKVGALNLSYVIFFLDLKVRFKKIISFK